ncbi:hypothetical protein Tco_0353554 [Tanacetum coccineum]
MDNLNITMEEYIRLEEEKAHRRCKVYNWEIAKYGKIWYNEDVHDLIFVETEFPAIVFDDAFTSEVTHSCEPTISSLNNNEIDFRISFDESDNEDYTVMFDKNSFSYKTISANDLKMNSENDNDKVNMPSFPSPEPTVSCLNDLDIFKDFENEFHVIVYNDALTSKSDFSTEPTLSPQHIDEFDLKDETSLSKPREGKSTNVGEVLTNLEIWKCWSLKNQDNGSDSKFLAHTPSFVVIVVSKEKKKESLGDNARASDPKEIICRKSIYSLIRLYRCHRCRVLYKWEYDIATYLVNKLCRMYGMIGKLTVHGIANLGQVVAMSYVLPVGCVSVLVKVRRSLR